MGRKISRILLVTVVALTVLWTCRSVSAEDKQKESKSHVWVTDVKPGVKLYGQVPEFAEVGQSSTFDVSPDGRTIAFGANDGIKLWDLKKKKVGEKLGSTAATKLEYSADGANLYAVTWGTDGKNQLQVFDAVLNKLKTTIELKRESEDSENNKTDDDDEDSDDQSSTVEINRPFYVQHLAVSPDDAFVAVGSGQLTWVFDVQSGKKVSEIKHSQYSRSLSFLDSGNQLVCGSGKIFDAETGEEKESLPGRVFGKYLQSIRVSPKNDTVAASAWNKGVILYDMGNKKKIELEIPGDKAKHFYLVEFSGNGKLVASSTYPVNQNGYYGDSSEIFVWDASTGKLRNKISLDTNNVTKFRFSANSDVLYTAGQSEIGVNSWHLDKKQNKEVLKGHTSPIYHIEFNPDGKTILATSQMGSGVVYDLDNGEPVDSLSAQNAIYLSMCKNGRYAVLGANYNSVAIYDLEKRKTKTVNIRSFSRPSLVARLGGFLTRKSSNSAYENFAISNVCIAEDNKHFIAVTRSQRNFRIEKFSLVNGKSVSKERFKMRDYWDWDSELDKKQQSNSKFLWTAQSGAVSSDGRLVAIINDAGNVFVVDCENGELLHELADEAESRQMMPHNVKLNFTPDGSRLVIAGGNSLGVWDMETGAQLDDRMKLGEGNNIYGMAMNRSGSRLAVTTQGSPSQVKLFDLEKCDEVFSKKLDEFYQGVSISDDGKKIALAKQNCQFEIWDLDELKDK